MLELAVFAIGLGSTLGISFPFSPQDYRRECRDMFPEALRVHSQLTNSPYTITTSDTFYEGVSHEKGTVYSGEGGDGQSRGIYSLIYSKGRSMRLIHCKLGLTV